MFQKSLPYLFFQGVQHRLPACSNVEGRVTFLGLKVGLYALLPPLDSLLELTSNDWVLVSMPIPHCLVLQHLCSHNNQTTKMS